mmetsp:Transcript_21341/g.46481  ORF Transcript_21341/g.46481 Transcript_21341/m.46481 type:complete len:224 (+) Transcript_21341:234-905(+)
MMHQMGEQFINERIGVASRYVSVSALRGYFNVDHAYAVKKLSMVLFPFNIKTWRRGQHGGQGDSGDHSFSPPKDDPLSPDLYIPLMAFVTYILAVGLHLGSIGTFTPDALGATASMGVVAMVLEIVGLWAGFTLLDSARPPWLEFLAYSGYKYVGITLNTIAGIGLGSKAYYVCLLYTGLAMAYFIMQSLKSRIATNHAGMYFLFGVSVFQLPLAYFLGTAPQ